MTLSISKTVSVKSAPYIMTDEQIAELKRHRARTHQLTAQASYERSREYSFNPQLQAAWQEVAANQYYYARVCMGAE